MDLASDCQVRSQQQVLTFPQLWMCAINREIQPKADAISSFFKCLGLEPCQNKERICAYMAKLIRNDTITELQSRKSSVCLLPKHESVAK